MIKVVGFNGPPIKECCGIRSPLYFDTEATDGKPYFFLAPEDKPQDYMSQFDVDRGMEGGNLTIVPFAQERIGGHVVLYASHQFFNGIESLKLTADMSGGAIRTWGDAWYLPEYQAKMTLSFWANEIALFVSKDNQEGSKDLLERALNAALGCDSLRVGRRVLRMLHRRYPEGGRQRTSLLRTARIYFSDFPNEEDLTEDY